MASKKVPARKTAQTRPASGRAATTQQMIREEIGRLTTWSERHERLLARLLLALLLTLLVDLGAAVLIWQFERHAKGTEVRTYGQAVFFTSVQVLTVSSSLKNPITVAGRVVDIFLEAWAVFVITAVGGSFAAFFQTGDSS